MDWKYKHFTQEAVFKASPESVLETARTVVAESLGEIENTTDGFIARGNSAWHTAIATFLYMTNPEASASKFIRERLHTGHHDDSI